MKQQEKFERLEQMRIEREIRAQQLLEVYVVSNILINFSINWFVVMYISFEIFSVYSYFNSASKWKIRIKN